MIGLGWILGLALALPAQDDVRTGLQERTVKVKGKKRDYLLYVPKSAPDKPLPIVMMIHGGGGTGRAAMKETRWDRKAEKEGFLAIFPNATRPDPTKPPQFGRNSPTWNDGSGRFHAAKEDVPDIAYLDAILDDVCKACRVDEDRIFVTGFSNGASMTFRAGVELSHRIRAIAPVAGALWLKKPRPKRVLPVLYITGLSDTLNPFEGGPPRFASGRRRIGGKDKPPVMDSMRTWAGILGVESKPTKTTEENGVKRQSFGPKLTLITIEDTGHVWMGGDNKLPEWMIGRDAGKLDATDVIWEFFASFKKEEGR
jgi:polyhydroxybutyrate depolymerase